MFASKQFERTYMCCLFFASVLLPLTQQHNYLRILLAYMFMPVVALQYFAAYNGSLWGVVVATVVYVTVMAAAFGGMHEHYIVAVVVLLSASAGLLVLQKNLFKQATLCIACALLGRSFIGPAAIIALLNAITTRTDMDICAALPPV